MGKTEFLNKLKTYGIYDRETFWADAFSRDIGLLSRADQMALAGARVAIAGLGGVGGVHLVTLARAGVGKFNIADFDVYEPANMNRQFGATVPALGRPKLDVMEEEALAINPFLEIRKFDTGVTAANVDDFLDGVDVVLDGVDFFCFEARRMVFNRARAKGIPVVTAGPLGYSSALLVFSPDGMSFDDYFDVNDQTSNRDALIAFAVGLAPRSTHGRYMDFSRVSFNRRRGPSLDVACQLCSALAVTEAMRLILKKEGLAPAPVYRQFDPYLNRFVTGRLRWGNRGPLQRLRRAVMAYLLDDRGFKRLPPAQWPTRRAWSSPIPKDVLKSLLLAGTYAPSVLNAQPWSARLGPDEIRVKAGDAGVDMTGTGTLMALGAVAENMKIAAANLGLAGDIRFSAGTESENPSFLLSVRGADVPKDFLFESVWERHTNRRHYDKRPLPEGSRESLDQLIEVFPGVRVHWIVDPTALKRVARVVFQSERARVADERIHRVVNEKIRWTREEIACRPDGLPLGNLEAGKIGEVFLRATRSWSVMRWANRLGLGHLAARHVARGVLESSGVALLTARGKDRDAVFAGGRAMERFWLGLTHLGLSVQPITPIHHFYDQWNTFGAKTFSPESREILERLWPDYQALFPSVDFARETHLLFVRVGYAPPMRWASPRFSPDQVLSFSQESQ
ncbi:MAG: ThiF family adenylyltransferase [Elusimicrobia bacterium]|nr:ThiF family adenylyltransferase [Elusimicrobiota bacterium]MBP8004104.1 ThiF family adenylyltransferase [Elusimicrobiota bacterium]